MLPDTTELATAIQNSDPGVWNYTAEGGANLVLSYTGNDPILHGKALRLRKRRHDGKVEENTTDPRFSESVITPLLGEDSVAPLILVEIDPRILGEISKRIEEQKIRPKERVVVDGIDTQIRQVIVTANLVNGQNILAVEIKPKWGFMPSTRFLRPETRPFKRRYCRFCMHSCVRIVKESNEENAARRHAEGYCPLGLYNVHNLEGISEACLKLWNMWTESDGIANNYRIFLHGKPLLPSQIDYLSQFLQSTVNPNATEPAITLANLVTRALAKSSILQTLSWLQASLDPLDIEGLSEFIQIRTGCTSIDDAFNQGLLGSQPTIDEWLAWKIEWIKDTTPMEDRSTRNLVLAYLLSATFKDCSIVITFRYDQPGEAETTVVAIDLDPKPLQRLGLYLKKDQEIVSGFSKFASKQNTLRKCVPGQ